MSDQKYYNVPHRNSYFYCVKSLAVIPSRFASSRFPGKPLADINGKPMIQRVYEQVQKAKQLNEVWVATDDARIFEAVESFGGKVLYTSEQCRNGTERCFEALSKLGDFDLLLNVQGDEPFIHPEDLDKLVEKFEEPAVDIATLMKRTKSYSDYQNPNRVKLVRADSGEAKYFSRSPIPYLKEGVPEECFLHIGVYAFRTSVLADLVDLEEHPLEKAESLEQLRWLLAGFHIYPIETDYDPIGVDHPEDLDKVREILGQNN